jgi:hypothetical protein
MLFEVMLGLKVNFHKRMLTRVNDINAWLNEATLVKNCKTCVLPFIYMLAFLLVEIICSYIFGTHYLTAFKDVFWVGKFVSYPWVVD